MRMILICVVSLMLTACQSGGINGAGFVLTKPKPETAAYITKNDRQFAIDTAANNRTCKRAPACTKKLK